MVADSAIDSRMISESFADGLPGSGLKEPKWAEYRRLSAKLQETIRESPSKLETIRETTSAEGATRWRPYVVGVPAINNRDISAKAAAEMPLGRQGFDICAI